MLHLYWEFHLWLRSVWILSIGMDGSVGPEIICWNYDFILKFPFNRSFCNQYLQISVNLFFRSSHVFGETCLKLNVITSMHSSLLLLLFCLVFVLYVEYKSFHFFLVKQQQCQFFFALLSMLFKTLFLYFTIWMTRHHTNANAKKNRAGTERVGEYRREQLYACSHRSVLSAVDVLLFSSTNNDMNACQAALVVSSRYSWALSA